MPNNCCGPRCRGNYTAKCKTHVFRYPRDKELLKKWIRAVPRQDILPYGELEGMRRTFLPRGHPEGNVTAPLPYPRLRKKRSAIEISRLSVVFVG
ncbi:hypothetical protein HPB49_023972 [Dermacentor silvarum]|uniref:Uncharacterized protein n=1 Tax=Dermacentor silvarum TaxID=543639 RepID=A0ACB8E463_DERSI|nr:hypothetical protein HPB49_023972 [Dermacentor silvarum]